MRRREKRVIWKGVVWILISAFCSATGQLLWKLGVEGSIFLLVGGFVFYTAGMLFMMLAFRHGEISILYPMLEVSVALSVVYGHFLLGEPLSIEDRRLRFHFVESHPSWMGKLRRAV